MKVAIIGAGIVGASAAYHLSRRADAEVILIDKEQKGKATLAGAGIICPWASHSDDPDWYRLAKEGAKFYPELIRRLKEDGEHRTSYKRVGALCVSDRPEKLDQIEEAVRAKKADAPELGEVQRLDAQETRRRFPPLNEELESVFVSGAARIDGRLLREAMVRAAGKNGARIVEGRASLISDGGKVTGVAAGDEIIDADQVIVTAGAWVPELLEPLGVRVNVQPQRGQILHIDMAGKDTSDWPVVLPQSSHYMLAFDDSRVVAGATRETGSGFDYRQTVGGVHEVTGEALRIAPGLSSGTLREVRIGFRPMGEDSLPLLGKLEELGHVTIATGLGPSGLTMGPYVGYLASCLAMGEETGMDLSAYHPLRGAAVN
ncbi:D-amino-acid dehydrogenase [Bhargavaea ginsengi]|uniref:D-amino-acid dehydrogenase n=1 Tax=Bhargavaea ginsengi TaxID=426757 RepID=A0A1H6U109_9BACL|nr:FAD-binding oxidoreductase [Bhargavaea ginsengi]SEI85971.1 D-amino-acid dehydrogenase [Bhargavaea ginsengi]